MPMIPPLTHCHISAREAPETLTALQRPPHNCQKPVSSKGLVWDRHSIVFSFLLFLIFILTN